MGFNDARPIMTSGKSGSGQTTGSMQNGSLLSEAAKRALAEAEHRRKEYRRREAAMPKEVGGRGGNEPGRYGDWEVKGLASDF